MDTFSICACHPCAGAMLVCGHVRSVGPRLGPQARNLRLLFMFRLCFSCAFARSSGPPLTPAEQGRPPLGWPPSLFHRPAYTRRYGRHGAVHGRGGMAKSGYFLDLCVSSLRRGHANLLCIVPILTVDSRRSTETKLHFGLQILIILALNLTYGSRSKTTSATSFVTWLRGGDC